MNNQAKNTQVSRRRMLQVGAGIIGASTLTGWMGRASSQQPLLISDLTPVTSDGMTPDQALQKLVEGNERFVKNKRENPHQDFARVTEVARGQHPFAAILSCADSRVVPEIIFDQGIGDLFVVRVAGNISSAEAVASHEFGTLILGAKVLMIIGHEACGAVEAAIKGGEFPGAIGSLVDAINPVVASSEGQPGDRLTNTIKANVALQVERIQASPVISKLVQEGKLKVVGGYYDLDEGKVTLVG